MKESFSSEEAVSPVIGVILMVAITVIMAAIVAGFVFGVISTPEATPTASIAYDDHVLQKNAGDTHNGSIDLLHQSGDSLDIEDLRIVVDNGTSEVTLTNETLGIWRAGENICLSDNSSFTEFSGDGLRIEEGKEYEVRIIHAPSGNSISQITFTAN